MARHPRGDLGRRKSVVDHQGDPLARSPGPPLSGTTVQAGEDLLRGVTDRSEQVRQRIADSLSTGTEADHEMAVRIVGAVPVHPVHRESAATTAGRTPD